MTKDENFNRLKELVHSLRPWEVKTAKRFLVAFETNVTRSRKKSLKLFKLLVNKSDISMEKARKIVSKEVDDTSFNKLVFRLNDKLLESLLLDINVNRTDAYSKWYRNRLDLRKKTMQACTIKGRGMDREALSL